MAQLIKEDPVLFEGHHMQTAEVSGHKPAWVPYKVWRDALFFLEHGSIYTKFKGLDGQLWVVRVN